jgi:hypothetical protein
MIGMMNKCSWVTNAVLFSLILIQTFGIKDIHQEAHNAKKPGLKSHLTYFSIRH